MTINREQPRAPTLVREVYTSDKALQQRKVGKRSIDIFSGLAGLEADETRMSNRGYDNDRSRLLRFMSYALPGFQSHQILDKYRDTMSYDERRYHIERVEALNHSLREIIDAEQFDSVRSLSRFIAEYAISMRLSSVDISNIQSSAREIIEGMRHEIAAESVLSSLNEVDDIRGATIEEDMLGQDVVVTYKGVELGLDIKASRRRADDLANRNRPGRAIIWSGVSQSEFGDKLVLANDTIKGLQLYYRQTLDSLIESQASTTVLA